MPATSPHCNMRLGESPAQLAFSAGVWPLEASFAAQIADTIYRLRQHYTSGKSAGIQFGARFSMKLRMPSRTS